MVIDVPVMWTRAGNCGYEKIQWQEKDLNCLDF